MSGKASGRVWDMDLPNAEMLVLQAMADHADHQGRNIYPGTELVAWKTGYSERQVIRIIDDLTQKGILVVTHHGGGRGHPTRYAIDFAAAPYKAPFRPQKKGDKMSPLPKNPDINGAKRVTSTTEKGDISDEERVTSATVKGDISTVKGDIGTRKTPLTVNPLTVIKEPSRNQRTGEQPVGGGGSQSRQGMARASPPRKQLTPEQEAEKAALFKRLGLEVVRGTG